MDNSLLVVDHLTKVYANGPMDITALEEVSFRMRVGEILSVIGPSGCGKSTLLKCIAGLLPITVGTIYIGGELVAAGTKGGATESTATDARRPSDRGKTGFVFQEPRLLPWRTVRQNVAFGLQVGPDKCTSKEQVRQRVDELIELVHLSGFEDNYPPELSGGMRQRVALARGLAIDPSILLMDEPLGALDELTKRRLQQELLDIIRQTGKTSIWVTHDLDEAIVMGDRIMVLETHPGRIREVLDVPFPRPRRMVELNKQPAYTELRIQMLELLAVDEAEAPAAASGPMEGLR